jgi:hypothetical protein
MPQTDEFKKGLRTAFARDVADPCWFHPEINIARLIRHALSHNGGRVTEYLKNQKHGQPDRRGTPDCARR